jgi:hypothetical protein
MPPDPEAFGAGTLWECDDCHATFRRQGGNFTSYAHEQKRRGVTRGTNSLFWVIENSPKAPISAQSLPQPSPLSGGAIAWIVLGCLAVLLIIIVGISALSSGATDTSQGSGWAISECEKVVRDSLKSPTTATFSSTAKGKDSDWVVTGTVDSENSFSAMVRSDYKCTIRPTKDDMVEIRIDYLKAR